LAAAVLEALTARGATVGVTTHYERLKDQATRSEHFANASVGFDFERMAPTFRLVLGVPGPSSALAVALRHGLPAAVIERAKALLPTQALEREAALRALSRERAEVEQLRREADAERTEQSELRAALAAEREAFQEQAAKEVDREVRDLRVSVRSARKELDELRARVRNTAADPSLLRELERGVSRVAAQVALGGELQERAPNAPLLTRSITTSELCVGQTVRHLTLGRSGQIIELCEREQVRLLIGSMKLLVPSRDLAIEPAVGRPKTGQARAKARTVTQPKPLAAAPQRTHDTTLDLRGERVEEALGRVESFIDRLLSIGEAGGFVLHGHGTGALKSSVREHLRASTYVERSRPAEADEGGDAFTVFWVRG